MSGDRSAEPSWAANASSVAQIRWILPSQTATGRSISSDSVWATRSNPEPSMTASVSLRWISCARSSTQRWRSSCWFSSRSWLIVACWPSTSAARLTATAADPASISIARSWASP